jgi:hypothetical protein
MRGMCWKRLVCLFVGHSPIRLKWTPPKIICRRCLRKLEPPPHS